MSALMLCKAYKQRGENPLRSITQDEKGLVLIVTFFYFIFWSQKKLMSQKLSKNSKKL